MRRLTIPNSRDGVCAAPTILLADNGTEFLEVMRIRTQRATLHGQTISRRSRQSGAFAVRVGFPRENRRIQTRFARCADSAGPAAH